jgi:hypothetical protein
MGLEQQRNHDPQMQLRVNASTPEDMYRLKHGEFMDVTSALGALIEMHGSIALDRLQAIAAHVLKELEST